MTRALAQMNGPLGEAGKPVLFPETRRVLYKKNPLEEVICQLRFPPLLKIEAELPAAFQEIIRKQYPLLKEQGEQQLIPPEISRALGAEFKIGSGTAFQFFSADEKWKVVLARDFLAVSTSQYERWESFRQHLTMSLGALNEQYSPSFFTRVGLRYRDVIKRSRLGLAEVSWAELLAEPILAELAHAPVANRVRHAAREILISLDEGIASHVRIKHGLAKANGQGETCYVIDMDFFTDRRTEINDGTDTLNEFNREAGRLFRWCIRDRLHDAMEPEPIL